MTRDIAFKKQGTAESKGESSYTLARRMVTGYLNNAPKCGPRRSQIHGLGLFATRNITAGETFMALPGGSIVAASSYLRDAAGFMEDEWNAVSENELLVRKIRTYYYFINHRSCPNGRVDLSRGSVIAEADIPAGEEITLNYLEEPLPKTYFAICDVSYLLRAFSKGRPS